VGKGSESKERVEEYLDHKAGEKRLWTEVWEQGSKRESECQDRTGRRKPTTTGRTKKASRT